MSIPEIQINLDYENRNSSVVKTITTPNGERIPVTVKFTGNIFKEWKKAKLMVNPHTPTDSQTSSALTVYNGMKDLYAEYKRTLPRSERLFYWLHSRRNKSKIINKIFEIYRKRQYTPYIFNTFENSTLFNEIQERGGHVLCMPDKDGVMKYIPINKIDDGTFDIPGYRLSNIPDGVKIPGIKVTQKEDSYPWESVKKESQTKTTDTSSKVKTEIGYDLTPAMIEAIIKQKSIDAINQKPVMKKTAFGDLAVHTSTNEVKKESTDSDLSPEIKEAIEKRRKEGVDTALSQMVIVDAILKEAKPLNDEVRSKYPLGTASSVDVVHEEVFGDLSIISEKTETVTKTHELPSNWEYPSLDTSIISNKTNMTTEADTISPNVEISEYTPPNDSDKLYKLVDGAYIEVTDDSSKY